MFAGLAAKFGVYAFAALAWIAVIGAVGTWSYRHGVKITKAEYDQQTAKNVQAARKAEQELWAARVAAEQERTRIAEESRRAASEDITALQADLNAIRARPVPVRIIRLLESRRSSAVPGTASIPGRVGSGTADSTGRTATDETGLVDAAVLASALRENAGRCERNIDRLNACRAAYDGVRAKLAAP